MELQKETVTFQITATHDVMEAFKRLMARLEYNCKVGHSAKVGMSIDGDGWDKFNATAEGYDYKAYMPEMTNEAYAGGGYGVEMASDHGYWLVRERMPK